MGDLEKKDRLAMIAAVLEQQGWLQHVDLGSKKFTRSDIKHFRLALTQAENLLAWFFGPTDKYGAHPNKSALLVQSLNRLNAELGRIEDNVHSPLLYQEESTRQNVKGSDPAVRRLITLVGLYARHYSTDFKSATTRNEHLSALIAGAGKKTSPSGVALWIKRFEGNFSGQDRRRDWSDADQWAANDLHGYITRILTPTEKPDSEDIEQIKKWEAKTQRDRAFWRRQLETDIEQAAVAVKTIVGTETEEEPKRDRRLRKSK